jgi:hypothetical protein
MLESLSLLVQGATDSEETCGAGFLGHTESIRQPSTQRYQAPSRWRSLRSEGAKTPSNL